MTSIRGRQDGRVVAISWIPSEAIKGSMKLPFELGIAHYDEPLPDVLGDLEQWQAEDRFRFANDLSAWIDVEDGVITDFGQGGGGILGSTTVGVGHASVTFQATAFPDIVPPPEVGDGWVRFQQSAGGRTGAPAPRHVNRPPFVQYQAPTAWSTLSLTLYADGRVDWGVIGASPFPRHWVYGPDGQLAGKTGLIDYTDWYRTAFGKNTPWGGEDSPALIAEVETALERELSTVIMKGGKPKVRKVKEGAALMVQGEQATSIYLLLDGVMSVVVDGKEVAALGPGALMGERAVLEGGTRTATLVAACPCKVAEARKVELDIDKLTAISESHRREDDPPTEN